MAAPPIMRMLTVLALGSAKMSDFQVARFAEVQASAKAASAAAEPELLAVLDSGAFRAALAACCPAFAGESATTAAFRPWSARAPFATIVGSTSARPPRRRSAFGLATSAVVETRSESMMVFGSCATHGIG